MEEGVLRPGDCVGGRYTVEAFVGAGAMGAVYRATHERLQRSVALKVLTNTSRALGERFVREGVALARLRHPAIVEVFDAGEDGALAWIAMELLEGETLGDALHRRGRLPPAEVAQIGRELAGGLGEAHGVGIIHRDLKPDNVFLALARRGRVQPKLLDFGVAHLRADFLGPSPSVVGALIGTPLYLSPEQAQGGEVDLRSDLWSLGAVLFQALTGRTPFTATSFVDLVIKLRDQRPPDVRSLATDVPDALARTVMACLDPDPARRPASAEEVVERLATSAPPSLGTLGLMQTAAATVEDVIPDTLRRSGPLTNLPDATSAFVGRQAEVAATVGAIGSYPLVTLFGAGGTGKTRLAVEVASRLITEHDGGVWFVDLSSARGRAPFVEAVASVLGLPLADPSIPAQDLVGRALGARGTTLLVLDNFEQLVLEAPVVAEWLAAAPALRILVTSRSPLRLADERVIELSPMTLADAVALFVDRAAAVGAPIDASERARVEDLALRLEGIPLALELAAARLRSLSIAQLSERLRDRFALLTTGRRDAPARQATLRAAIDWSWGMLEADEQAALSELSVFRGGFSLDLAERVVAPGGRPVLDLIESLRERSLLTSRRAGGEPRFDRLETVREYAAAKLEERGAARAARERHARTFAAWDRSRWDPPLAERRRLALEHDNLAAACDFAKDAGLDELAVTAALALVPLSVRGPWPIFTRLDAALASAKALPEALRTEARVTRAFLLSIAAPGDALDELEALARSVTTPSLRARVLLALANTQAAVRSLAASAARVDEALGIDGVPPDLHANVLVARGNAAWKTSDLEAAESVATRALEEAARVDAPFACVGGNTLLGIVAFQRGDRARARACYEAALELSRSLGARNTALSLINNLGIVHFDQGALAEAEEHLRRAMGHARDMGLPIMEGIVMLNLGLVAEAAGRRRDAQGWLQAAVRTLASKKESRYRSWATAWLATVTAGDGRPELADELLTQACALAESVDNRELAVAMEVLRGHVELARGDVAAARARAAAARASPLFARQENVRFTTRSLERALAPCPA